ncbi:hypothetical protein JJJ10_22185 [Klebsiella grimontii]|uniref:hypothetical protein n=1 Tax=Klebsiella grimontii TaxID=2058152 RepID=UPI0011132874|nr:hypothetical protein [Klebsiella grimontii]MBZ6971728.1 hypothetical protein [Klebsiella grimontii]MBZ7826297.1 hypothetical protein [Klebsiella grimontii]MDM4405848.1 hypothetical protein [Klebsiella grimontii]QTP39125.1 hypothetical protein JJJ10_22185 [Klebsiella grimontii]
MTGTDNIPVKSTSILVRLLRGEFGLEKTFWLFGFFPTWLVSCIPYFTKPEWNTAIRTDIISIVWGGIILESTGNVCHSSRYNTTASGNYVITCHDRISGIRVKITLIS